MNEPINYFWEFFMLFLAVTAGYFVENRRENFVERQRAKQFARALLEDFENDRIDILDVIEENRVILDYFDKIREIIQNGIKDHMVPGRFYVYCNVGTASPNVVWNNTTFSQMTHSGSLRYFKNPELVKKISVYYSTSDYTNTLNQLDKKWREKTMEIRNQILDYIYFSQYSLYNITYLNDIPDDMMDQMVPIQPVDSMLLNEFVNSFENRRAFLTLLTDEIYPRVIEHAVQIKALLKNEFNLE